MKKLPGQGVESLYRERTPLEEPPKNPELWLKCPAPYAFFIMPSEGMLETGLHPISPQPIRKEMSEHEQEIKELLEWFAYTHLPEALQEISAPIGDIAHHMADKIGPNGGPELKKGLDKLLEAKDCFVRAQIRAAKAKAKEELSDS